MQRDQATLLDILKAARLAREFGAGLTQLGKILLVAAMAAALASVAGPAAAQCVDPAGECTDPCPARNSCIDGADCDPGFACLPYGTPGVPCNPGGCVCDAGTWLCTPDCASQCVAESPVAVPAASPRGLLGLAAILSVAAWRVLARRRRRAETRDFPRR